MSGALKKLWNDNSIGVLLVGAVLLYVFYMLFQYLDGKRGYRAHDTMSQSRNSAYQNSQSSGNVPQPAMEGSNATFQTVNGGGDSHVPAGASCAQGNNPADLLPNDANSEWSQFNPQGKGELANINFLKAGYHIGIDTIGQTMRNPNLQMRSEPANPQVYTGPWNLPTIEPDFMRPPLEIGNGMQ